MTPEEAYSLRLITDVRVTEIGLIHVETWMNRDDYASALFLNGRKITRGLNEWGPLYLQGKLYYVRSEREKSHLVMQENFGEPAELLSLGKIKKFALHRKGILIVGEEVADRMKPMITERLKYRFDGRGLLRTRQSLYLYDGELRKLVSGDFDVTDVASNGNRVVITSTVDGDDYGLSNVYEVDVDTGELKRLTKGENSISAVAVNEEGEVAFLGHRRGKTPWAVRHVFLIDEEREYQCGKTCGSSVITDLFDSVTERLIFKGDQLLSLGQEGGSVNVYLLSDGKSEDLTRGELVVRGFDYNGELAYFYTAPEKPSLLQYKGRTYDPNPQVNGITPARVHSGVQGWGLIIDREAPTILFVHGGPHMAYGNAYYIEFQFFVKNGYNVIFCNPRGSQGYGEDFAEACVGDWGGGDMQDILQFTRDAITQFGLKGKLGITGGSYGGFMTNWMVTQTDLFSAAVSERGISNLVSMCGTSDIGFWFNAVEAGIQDPWSPESIDRLMRSSPIYHVKRVRTPVMLIHGEEDYRCPIEQAEQFYTALKMNGVPTRLIRYQGDGHEHARRGRPENVRDRLKRKLEWFDLHLGKK